MSISVPMSTVSMTLTAEEFITAESAKISFTATYAITDTSVDAKAQVLDAAKKLYEGDWYVTGVEREESSAGIETVIYGLSIRVPEAKIGVITSGVKNVNRSGLRFEIRGTDYTPTQKQVEDGNKNLRRALYKKANEELAVLNDEAGDGDDKWIIGNINFNAGAQPAMVKSNQLRGTAFYESVGNAAGGGDEDGEGGVTQKLSLSAVVSFTRKIYSRL